MLWSLVFMRGRNDYTAMSMRKGDLLFALGRSEVIVFLVDTPVEQENGFSLSESTTSPKLSRYTFDMF
jgi:hypothetical protein